MAESLSEEFWVQTFQPYEKMSVSTKLWESKRLDGIKNWVAMEKIHGANFSFSVLCRRHELARTSKCRSRGRMTKAESVLVARRGGYLKEGEVFFGVQTQEEFLEGEKEKARHVCKAVREKVDCQSEQVESVTVFGELFGGWSFVLFDTVQPCL